MVTRTLNLYLRIICIQTVFVLAAFALRFLYISVLFLYFTLMCTSLRFEISNLVSLVALSVYASIGILICCLIQFILERLIVETISSVEWGINAIASSFYCGLIYAALDL